MLPPEDLLLGFLLPRRVVSVFSLLTLICSFCNNAVNSSRLPPLIDSESSKCFSMFCYLLLRDLTDLLRRGDTLR